MQYRPIQTLLPAAAASMLFAMPVNADTQACSRDTFSIEGKPVSVALCVAGTAPGTGVTVVTVNQTFASGSASFVGQTQLELLPGAQGARSIEDVALAPLGIQHTLHLTVGYTKGQVRLEHALLIPGAIALK